MRDAQGPRLDGQTVMVTGAGGFIGSAVVRALLPLGATVRALLGPPGQDTIGLPAGLTQEHGDIEDRAVLRRLVADAEIVVHLAGPPSVAASFQAPGEYGRVHVGGTLALLEVCRDAGLRRFVYVSSAEVYGRPTVNPVTEEHALQPRSPYAAAKAAAEQFVGAYHHVCGMETLVLRPFSVYGPGLRHTSVLGTIVRQVLRDDQVVLADLAPVRDYLFLDDAVEGILRAATAEDPPFTTFNLSSGGGTSVGEVAQLALRLAGRDLPVHSDRSGHRPAPADIDHLVGDSSRARLGLGWSPSVALEEGLCRTLRWMGAPG